MVRKFDQDTYFRIIGKFGFASSVLDLLDFWGRKVKRKGYLPPLSLRAFVGDYKLFEVRGKEYLRCYKEFLKLKPNEKILDIGCGCGRTTLYLTQYLSQKGSYAGMDISKKAIRWCQDHITPKHPNFQFFWSDIRNTFYNKNGTHLAENYKFPFDSQEFDAIVLTSVFTHMLPEQVANYLEEIHRLLKTGGRCLATFFVLNKEQEKLNGQGLNHLNFQFGDATCRHINEKTLESAVGYDEDYILQVFGKYHFRLIEPIRYGTWSGRSDGYIYQDALIIVRS